MQESSEKEGKEEETEDIKDCLATRRCQLMRTIWESRFVSLFMNNGLDYFPLFACSRK